MLVDIEIVFSVPVISWIKFICGEWVEGDGVGSGTGWEAEGGLKHPIVLEQQCCAFSK